MGLESYEDNDGQSKSVLWIYSSQHILLFETHEMRTLQLFGNEVFKFREKRQILICAYMRKTPQSGQKERKTFYL